MFRTRLQELEDEMAVAAAQLSPRHAPRRPVLRLVEAEPARRDARRIRPAAPVPTCVAGHPTSAAVRRRRQLLAVVVGLVAAVLVAAALAALRPSASLADQVAEAPPVVVVVGEGETVWDVVAPHVPAGTEHRAYVAEVVAANGVDARRLAPGSALRLP